MLNPLDMIQRLCAHVDPLLVERHLRRMPASYFERYSAADVARHVRFLAQMEPEEPVSVEVRPLGPMVYEIVIGCENLSGTLACITTALAADGFDLEDVHIASYEELPETAEPEPNLSVIQLRVSSQSETRNAAELASDLRDRLRPVFFLLAQGQFLEAQAAASANRLTVPDEPAVEEPESRAAVGTVLAGEYRLEQLLGRGGMSEIFLATQLSLDRTVAVKVARQQAEPESDLVERFAREAVVLAQFNCPYIVPVLAAGTLPGNTGVYGWIAMEYQAGGDLARWLHKYGPPPIELGLRWFRQSLEALRYAHHNAVLHRDLKPHNLLLTAESNVKVGDFGLFKRIQVDDPNRTTARAVDGTPHYMSPEQARGEHLDERSDIFSLGTTFFHIFSGRLPFEHSSPGELMRAITQSDAPRISAVAPQLPVPLDVILARMLARPCDLRYQDVGVILEDLASYESRGLLRGSASGSFIPIPTLQSASAASGDTQAYVPAPSHQGAP